jgi:hypothetical protein
MTDAEVADLTSFGPAAATTYQMREQPPAAEPCGHVCRYDGEPDPAAAALLGVTLARL